MQYYKVINTFMRNLTNINNTLHLTCNHVSELMKSKY